MVWGLGFFSVGHTWSWAGIVGGGETEGIYVELVGEGWLLAQSEIYSSPLSSVGADLSPKGTLTSRPTSPFQLWPPWHPFLSNTPNSFLPQGLGTYCALHWMALPLSWHGRGHIPLRPECKHCGLGEFPHLLQSRLPSSATSSIFLCSYFLL